MESCGFLGRVLSVPRAEVDNYQRNLVHSYEGYQPQV